MDHRADFNVLLMSCWGLMQGEVTRSRKELCVFLTLHLLCNPSAPSAEQLLATEPHSYSPHIEGPWGLAQDSRYGVRWGL